MKTLLAILLLTMSAVCAGAGTINLPVGPYCATTLTDGVFNGVTSGACVAPPTSGSCPAVAQTPNGTRTRQIVADVKYGVAGSGTRRVQMGEYPSLYGFNDALPTSVMQPWPGVSGSSPNWTMSRTGYVGLHFRTTPAPTPSGYFVYGNYGGSIPISASISKACGDFAGNPATNGCYITNRPSNDASALLWFFGSGVSPYRCYLQPNTDYYLNVTFTDPHPTNPLLAQKCSAGAAACPILLKSMGH